MNSNVNEYLTIHLSTKMNEIAIVMKLHLFYLKLRVSLKMCKILQDGTFFVIIKSYVYLKKKLGKLKVDHKIKKIQQFFLIIV
jgi:hypothetical protein